MGMQNAVEKVQPSAKREGFTTIPDVTWEDVGSLADVREDLEFSICRAIKFPEEYQVHDKLLLFRTIMNLVFICTLESILTPFKLDYRHWVWIWQLEYFYMVHQVVVKLLWQKQLLTRLVPISYP